MHIIRFHFKYRCTQVSKHAVPKGKLYFFDLPQICFDFRHFKRQFFLLQGIQVKKLNALAKGVSSMSLNLMVSTILWLKMFDFAKMNILSAKCHPVKVQPTVFLSVPPSISQSKVHRFLCTYISTGCLNNNP